MVIFIEILSKGDFDDMILAPVILLSTIGATLFLAYLMSRRPTHSKRIVQYPKVIFVVGSLSVIAAAIIACVFIVQEAYEPLIGVSLPFILGVYLILKVFVWRIEYNKDMLIFRNIVGFKRSYRYEDIVKIVIKKDKYYTLFFGHNKITVDMMSVNSEQFLHDIKKKKHKPMIVKKT